MVRRLLGALALVAALVIVPAPPAGSASTCDQALAKVRVPKLVEVRCIPGPWPFAEGWTTDGQDIGVYRTGMCVCGPGWASHVEVYANRPVEQVAFTIAHELGHAYAALAGSWAWNHEPFADHFARCVTTRTANCS